MQRLYKAAKQRDPTCTRQVDIAKAINESNQRVNNWEARGISKDGAIAAQRLLGISATYLLDGTEPAFLSQSQPARLTGDMIRSAYSEAQNMASSGGAEADDFNPSRNSDDAGIFALVLNRYLAQPAGKASGSKAG